MQSQYLLLDTSVLSEARRREPIEKVTEFLRSLPDEVIAIPMIAVFELERGARSLMMKDYARGRLYLDWLSELVSKDVYFPPMTVDVYRLIARMAAVPAFYSYWRNSGPSKRLRFGCDPAIAAVSIVHGIPIVSLDTNDFLRIHHFFPLPGLYDPVRDIWHVPAENQAELLSGSRRTENVLFKDELQTAANSCR